MLGPLEAYRDGVDVGFFALPPVERGQPAPTFGSGVLAAAFHDRPEIREFLRALTSPEWGEEWAGRPGSNFLPAHAAFDPEQCRPSEGDPNTGDLRVQLCAASRDGIAAGVWRYDASDLMPPPIGGGAFWQGMVDYFDQGPTGIDPILADIEGHRGRLAALNP